MSPKQKPNREQLRALKATEVTAAQILTEDPATAEEIAFKYRRGATERELAEQYVALGSASLQTPRLIIGKVLSHLIPKEEQARLREEHRKAAGKATGAHNKKHGTGFFITFTSYDALRDTPVGPLTEQAFVCYLHDQYAGGWGYWRRIAEETNALYRNNRTPKQIRNIYSFWRNRPTSSAQS